MKPDRHPQNRVQLSLSFRAIHEVELRLVSVLLDLHLELVEEVVELISLLGNTRDSFICNVSGDWSL
jgi:hypothetical protein